MSAWIQWLTCAIPPDVPFFFSFFFFFYVSFVHVFSKSEAEAVTRTSAVIRKVFFLLELICKGLSHSASEGQKKKKTVYLWCSEWCYRNMVFFPVQMVFGWVDTTSLLSLFPFSSINLGSFGLRGRVFWLPSLGYNTTGWNSACGVQMGRCTFGKTQDNPQTLLVSRSL